MPKESKFHHNIKRCQKYNKIVDWLFYLILVFSVLYAFSGKFNPEDQFLNDILFFTLFFLVFFGVYCSIQFSRSERRIETPCCNATIRSPYPLEKFCPACGALSSPAPTPVHSNPQCSSCQTVMITTRRQRKGLAFLSPPRFDREYKIHYCTCCGAYLSEKGF